MKLSCSWLVFAVVVAGCGDGATQSPDAAPSRMDAPADAAADAAVVPVTVTVRYAAQAIAGVTVIFQGPDQQELGTATTDASGVAAVVMPAGGFVTVIYPSGTQSYLRTWADVQPGDQLQVDLSISAQRPPPIATMTLALPQDPAVATDAPYLIVSQCGGTYATGPGGDANAPRPPLSAKLTISQGCGSTVDVIVMSLDHQSVPVDYVFVPGIAVGNVDVDLAAQKYASTFPTTLILDSLFDVDDASEGLALVGPSGGGPIYLGNIAGLVPDHATAMTVRVPPPSAALAYLELGSLVTDHGGGVRNQHRFGRRGAMPTIDGYRLSPQLINDLASRGVFDQATARLTYATLEPMLAADVYAATITDHDATSTTTWQWQIVGRATTSTIQFPTLPGAAAMFNPVAGDAARIVDLELASVTGGYDAMRTRAFDAYSGDLIFDLSGLAGAPTSPISQFDIERWIGP